MAILLDGTTGISASGNISVGGSLAVGGSFAPQAVSTTGNVTGGNLLTSGQISAAGNLTVGGALAVAGAFSPASVSATGNITGAVFSGNGSGLSAIAGANVTGTVADATNAVNVTGATQANITAVGTLTALSVSGNVTAGNMAANIGAFTTITGQANASSLSSGTVPSDRLSGSYTINISGAATTAATVTSAAQPNVTSVGTLSSLSVSGTVTAGNLTVVSDVVGNLIPSANVTYDLGSPTRQWKDIYVGPGSLYVNGQKVLEDNSGTIVVTANINQNLALQTTGTGDIEFAPQATGVIAVKGTTQFDPSYNIGTTDGNALPISVGIKTDSITAKTANTNLSLSGAGSGHVNVSGDLTVTGNLAVTGNAANLSVTNLSVQDNIINIAAETTGTPTQNAGLQVVRGDDPNVQLRWNEDSNTWQFTNDGTNYQDLVGSVGGNVTVGNVTATNIAGTLTTATQTNITSVGTLGALSVTGTVTAGNVTATNVTGTLATAAQTNITSVGTLGALSVSGNVTPGNLVTAGTVDAASLTTSGNVIVGGNLVVNGNTTYINITDLNVEDPIIGLGRGANNAPLTSDDGKDRGEQLWYFDTAEKSAFLGWDDSAGKLIAAANVTVTNEIVTVGSYGTFVVGNLEGANVSVTGDVTAVNVTGTLLTATQTNITSVGTLGALSVTGTVTAGNVTATNVTGTLATAAQTNITSVGTLGALSVSGNVDAGNLRTAGVVSATGAITGAAITGTSLTVSTGNVTLGNIVNGGANGVGNIGSATTAFNTIFAKATSAQYADLAEMYQGDAAYTPGTVLVYGGSKEVTQSMVAYSTAIAGVVSEAPAYIMNAGLDCEHPVAVAMIGRVPCRVTGEVSRGDLLVASPLPGVAQRLDPAQYQPGAVIGKALENHSGAAVSVIEIAVGRL